MTAEYLRGPFVTDKMMPDPEHPALTTWIIRTAEPDTLHSVWIGETSDWEDGMTPEDAEAAALLFAASAELNAALADLVDRIERDALIQMRDLMPARRALAHVRGECYLDAGRPCEIHTALGTRRTS